MPGTTPQPAPVSSPADVDVLVVGAGFGGLGAAMGLLDRGARVLVCERLDYPGGCAGTFTRRGGRYDAGATLSSGFGHGQLFAGWARRHAMDLRVSPLDPVVELRAPGLTLPVWADRARFVDTIAGLAGAHADAVRRFFAYQAGVAATLWRVLDDPGLLPPLGAGGVLAHLRHLGGYLPVARWLGRPLTAVLARFGLEHVAPLRLFCDAVCQITVQCPAHEAEAPFALATLDYFFRGVAHVHGGIGELARALVGALVRRGADVRYHCPVRRREVLPLRSRGLERVAVDVELDALDGTESGQPSLVLVTIASLGLIDSDVVGVDDRVAVAVADRAPVGLDRRRRSTVNP